MQPACTFQLHNVHVKTGDPCSPQQLHLLQHSCCRRGPGLLCQQLCCIAPVGTCCQRPVRGIAWHHSCKAVLLLCAVLAAIAHVLLLLLVSVLKLHIGGMLVML